jgi:glutamine---fructose-6-phosphate transaminase (isomerizing)
MCGITGFITNNVRAAEMLLARDMAESHERLRSRGYDSAGATLAHADTFTTFKFANGVGGVPMNGSLPRMVDTLTAYTLPATRGISHTRWASCGRVTRENTHPHLSNDGRIALVHNGHLNNCEQLRAELSANGSRFVSETDSEVIAELIARARVEHGSLVDAVTTVLPRLDGTYGLAIISTDVTDPLVLVSHGSPLHLGQDTTEYGVVTWVASEDHALAGRVSETMRLPKESIVTVSRAGEIVSSCMLEHCTPQCLSRFWCSL